MIHFILDELMMPAYFKLANIIVYIVQLRYQHCSDTIFIVQIFSTLFGHCSDTIYIVQILSTLFKAIYT